MMEKVHRGKVLKEGYKNMNDYRRERRNKEREWTKRGHIRMD